jgi:hypothetical protein
MQLKKNSEVVTLAVSKKNFEAIRQGDICILPVYRSEWSVNKFLDSGGFEKSFKYIQFRYTNTGDFETVTCKFGGIKISGSEHYIRVGDSPVKVFQGDFLVRINEVVNLEEINLKIGETKVFIKNNKSA